MFRSAIRLTGQLRRTGRLGAFLKDSLLPSFWHDRKAVRPIFVMSAASSGSTWIAGMLGHLPHHVFVHELKLCAGIGGKSLLFLQAIRAIVPGRLAYVLFEAFERGRMWTLDAHLERLRNERPELVSPENLKTLQLGKMGRTHWDYSTIDSSGASIAMVPLLQKAYPNAVFCFILRDPRDVCMSIMRRKPWGDCHRIEGWVQVWIKDLQKCNQYKDAYGIDVLRYEAWLRDTAGELCSFVQRHNLDMPEELQREAVEQHNAVAMQSGKVPRKGNAAVARSGAWAEVMSPDEKQTIKPMISDMLIELGYETSTDW